MVQGKDYKPLIIHKLLLHEIAMKNSLCHFTVYLPCMFAALSGQRPYRNVYIYHQMKHTLNEAESVTINQIPTLSISVQSLADEPTGHLSDSRIEAADSK